MYYDECWNVGSYVKALEENIFILVIKLTIKTRNLNEVGEKHLYIRKSLWTEVDRISG